MLILLINSNYLFAEDYRNVSLKELTLEGYNTFSEIIYVNGRVTITENATLIINPGTRVIFVYMDLDGDGIGDSEILSQGKVIVKGTKENPVIFESDRKEKGSWLGFSIMNVDGESMFNYAIFQDSYMALHSHFSNLRVENTIFRNNLRGFQSQEGKIYIKNCEFYNNNTGLQFRNSRAEILNTSLYDNIGGVNFLYSDVLMKDINIVNNSLFGLKVRFSKAEISNADFIGSMQNFYGKSSEIKAEGIRSISAFLRGLSFEASKVIIKDSKIMDNLLDGISIDNSFLNLSGASFLNNGRYDIYAKGESYLEDMDKFKDIKIFRIK